MKNSFIPVNSIEKALAFAPSLTADYRTNQRIKTKQGYIETIDAVYDLEKNQGWKVESVCENRNRTDHRVNSHYVKMYHPDLTMKNNEGQTECLSNLYLSNSCSGNQPLDIKLGAFRLVCSNGAISFQGNEIGKISHDDKGVQRYPLIMNKINELAQATMNAFDSLKNKELTSKQIMQFAAEALDLRFKDKNINAEQLLNVHRPEDEGNSLWAVFNRIQENLTKPNMLVDMNGRLIGGTSSVKQDIKVNQDLFQLAEAYA
jgi:hypothetical protein